MGKIELSLRESQFVVTQSTYPGAVRLAERVHAHLKDLTEAAPAVELLAEVISITFWASLRREEGLTPKVSLAFLRRGPQQRPLFFERPLAVTAASLTKLAPTVERPGIHLGVERDGHALVVWGALRELPPYCCVLEVLAPGHLVIKYSREADAKFVNLAVLHGDEVKIIDPCATARADCPDMVSSLLGFEARFTNGAASVLIELAVSMRAHGHGGSLLVVPAGSDSWRESIAKPIAYGVDPPFRLLADLMQEDASLRARRRWREALHHAVEGVAGLTAIDGAAVISDAYEVLAFGVKIMRRAQAKPVDWVVLSEPVENARMRRVEPTLLGGTRHMSAAQFAQDQPDALALVASQDGRFTVFGWSLEEASVRAHRIESLLV